MLRSIDFKTMPYLFTDKAGTCLTVEFDGRELDDIYKQVKAMYDQAHSSDDMPTEPGWYATRDGEDLLSYDGDAWHIHNIDCDAQLFADGDLETMDWSVVKRTFDADAFPLIPVNLNDTSRAERRLTNLTNFLHTLIHECETVRDNPSSDKHTKDIENAVCGTGINFAKDLLARLENGVFDQETWKADLKTMFSECFRVLKEHGVLIFKWNETQIPVSQILKLTAHKPLFGNKQPNRTGTHWIVFMKEDAK